MKLSDIAKEIANHAHMPYSWEDVLNRLKEGRALPYTLTEFNDQPPNQKVANVCATCGGKPADYYGGYGYRCSKHEPV